jgi:membrane associated rhomboid family serine protease
VNSILEAFFRSRRPIVNLTLIAINALVFIYTLSLSGLDQDIFFWKYGLIPLELSGGIEFEHVGRNLGLDIDITSPIPTWGTVFTSMFIHAGPIHFVGNMLFLYGFGGGVEERLGHVKYLIFYLACGVAAAWAQVATDLDSRSVLIGASGAISGVVGAYLLAYPYRNAVALLAVFFVLPLLLSVGSFGPVSIGTGVAYMAHLGGLVAGVLLMVGYKLLLREPIRPPRPPHSQPWKGWE